MVGPEGKRVPPSKRTGPRRPYEVIETIEALARVATALARETIIGFEVETTLYRQELRLVQISTRERTYVIDPLSVASLEPLRPILAVTGPTKVIHNAAFERRVLAEKGFEIANVFDTLRVSRQIGLASLSHRLQAVCERHVGRSLDKSEQISDWGARPLSKSQLVYAASDAEVLLELYDVLRQHDQVDRAMF